jgi:glycosyltransferase involved in cell wall biosynthesis
MTRFSIILCTLGSNLDLLKRCLLSIKRQSFSDYSVMVIYQGGGDIQKVVEEISIPIKYLTSNIKSLSLARNMGIRESDAEYLVFMDDDAYMEGNFLEMADRIIRDTKASGLAGIVLNDKDGKLLGRSIKKDRSFFLKLDDYNQWMSSATIIKKEDLSQIGCYDEDFGIGGKWYAAEDSDVAIRLLLNNKSLYFCTDLIVYHPSENDKLSMLSFSEVFIRGFRYGTSRSALLKKVFSTTHRKKWAIKYWIILITYSVIGGILSIFRLNMKYILLDIGNFFGRLTGFLSYRHES